MPSISEALAAKGWLTTHERRLLIGLASQVPPKGVIVNIGVEFGASVVCLRAGNPTAAIFGVDIDTAPALPEAIDCCDVVYQQDSGALALEWNTDWATVQPSPIDLLFIDGNHTQKGIERDLAWLGWLPVGGIVAFHDCYDWGEPRKPHKVCPEVNIVVQDW